MTDLVDIMAHWYSGRSYTQVARSLGIDRATVVKYTAPARAERIVPGGPPVSEEQWREKLRGWSPSATTNACAGAAGTPIAPHHGRAAELVKVVPVSVLPALGRRGGPRRATAASGASSGPSSTRCAPRRWSCGAHPCTRGKKRKSTGYLGTWPDRPPATTAGCGVPWCCRYSPTCSCARYYGWTRRPGPSHVAAFAFFLAPRRELSSKPTCRVRAPTFTTPAEPSYPELAPTTTCSWTRPGLFTPKTNLGWSHCKST